MSETIRPIAICVIRRGGEILVFESFDRVKGETFYRPLGGGIEFDELGKDAVAREIQEEIDAELKDVSYVGAIENLFSFERRRGHEIALVYEATFADPTLCDRITFDGVEDNGEPIDVKWLSLEYFRQGSAPLYPDNLLELIS
ncbi:MAG: NUDIX domain-containing protein [Gammaproteobacteria bacterium]|nr:NUDIX domain-containing protein [Gammaproteobacteria bacterium]